MRDVGVNTDSEGQEQGQEPQDLLLHTEGSAAGLRAGRWLAWLSKVKDEAIVRIWKLRLVVLGAGMVSDRRPQPPTLNLTLTLDPRRAITQA